LNVFALLAIPALILINALFVAVEYALVAVRKTRVEEMVKNGVSGAKSVESAIANINRSIAATQLGITLASIALGAIGEPAVAQLIQPLFDWLPATWQIVTKHSVATIIALLLITILHVILGEQVPKMAALKATDQMALWLAQPLNVWARLSLPIVIFMNAVGNRLLRLLRLQATGPEKSIHSVDELRLIIEDTQEAGLLETDQAIFVQNVFELTDKTVRDCMIPREKMDAIEFHTPSEKVLEIVRDCGHTRLPVYDGTLDNIVGILNTKNLFYFFSLQNAVVLDDALYPATYLDPDEGISKALRLFRKSRRPMAVVRDKDGRVLGLITLEDILEEIVGELEDEHDAPVPKVNRSTRVGKKKK
jgi:CBS domain containing-hemolysin-like protein